jgi:hypothetical protein
MPFRPFFVLLAAIALMGCAARPAVCKLPPQLAHLAVESPTDVVFDVDVDMTTVVVESETEVIASYTDVPACGGSISP